jgi:hypothetical protein
VPTILFRTVDRRMAMFDHPWGTLGGRQWRATLLVWQVRQS